MPSVDAVDPYTVEFQLKTAVGSFPINLVMGIVQAGSGAANARAPIGTGPYRLAEFIPDDRIVLAALRPATSAARRTNAGVVLKVMPDDTMRGLELRKGTVDLVVNDVSPDIVWQMQHEGRMQVATGPGTDYAYIGLNLQDPVLQPSRGAQGDRLCDRPRRHRQLSAARLCDDRGRDRAADVVGVRARRIRLPPRPGEAERLLDAAGFPDPDGRGRFPACA